MSYFDALMDTGRAVARSILGDGYGQGLKFDQTLVAKSAAYNKIGGVARDMLNVGVTSNALTRENADEIRKLIKEGKEEGLNKATSFVAQMKNSDNETAKNIATRFEETMKGYENAQAGISDYAEFLGRQKGQGIGLINTASGYFLDAQNGNQRVKAAAIAGAGVAVAGRVISGGTLTHRNTGERDIAGVPFI